MKVKDFVARLRAGLGSTWKSEPWDGLQAGSLDAEVTGIAVVWSPSLEALERAVLSGLNLILCKAPLFWNEAESPLKSVDSSTSRLLEGTAGATPWATVRSTDLYKIKRTFVDAHGLNLFRVSENWAGSRSLATQGVLRALGWRQTASFVADPRNPSSQTSLVSVPSQTLGQVADHAKLKLGARSTRLLGDRSASVGRVAVHPGYLTMAAAATIGKAPDVDVILTGEGCEWEAFAYAEDWITEGRGKGLIMPGLAVISDAAAHEVASWIREIIPGEKIEALVNGDPFLPVVAGVARSSVITAKLSAVVRSP